jgi:hypothetical protein
MHTTKHRKHEHGYIRVEFGERQMGGNPGPYWSVTAEISSSVRFTDRSIHSGGCLHEDVAKYFPEIAPTIRWHLSYSGIPMHYIANAKFWYDGANGLRPMAKYDPEPRKTFVSHVVPLAGDEPLAWLDLPWPECQALLESREAELRAAYKREVLDLLPSLHAL